MTLFSSASTLFSERIEKRNVNESGNLEIYLYLVLLHKILKHTVLPDFLLKVSTVVAALDSWGIYRGHLKVNKVFSSMFLSVKMSMKLLPFKPEIKKKDSVTYPQRLPS